jgi:YD repeat-containing protein
VVSSGVTTSPEWITIDANANTTSSAGISNTYDFENRTTGHGSLTLVYDGDGNRVSETIGETTTTLPFGA